MVSLAQVFVEFVVKNPAYVLGEPIASELFIEKLDGFVRGLPTFA